MTLARHTVVVNALALLLLSFFARAATATTEEDSWGAGSSLLPGKSANDAGEQFVPAALPNGMSMHLPSNVLSSELPYALDLAGNDLQAFASTAASLSSNPALASAAHSQAMLKGQLSSRISALEANVIQRQKVVATALYEVQRAVRVLSLAQRDAYVARSALANTHRQLAALDVNSRRLADAARLADLQRALSLTTSTLVPGAVLTATQRVVNAQLAASLRDQIARTQARITAAGKQIDAILAANETATAVELYRSAEQHEGAAQAQWALAQKERNNADRVNTVRAHVLASKAHVIINQAGVDAGSGQMVKPADTHANATHPANATAAHPPAAPGAPHPVAAAHPAGAPAAAPAAPAAAPPASFKQQGLAPRFASSDLRQAMESEEATSERSHTNAHSESVGSAPLVQGASSASLLGSVSGFGSSAGGGTAGSSAALRGGSHAEASSLRHNRAASLAGAHAGTNVQQRRVAGLSTASSQSQAQAQAQAQARVEAALAQTAKISQDTRLHRSAEEDESLGEKA